MSTEIAVRHATLINLTAEWRPVLGYEGRYMVSDEGQVVAVGRTLTDSVGRQITRRPRLLRPATNADGYQMVSLDDGQRKGSQRVHRLVLLAFLGTPPEGKPEACHINGVPADNRLANLRWGSHSDNMRDKQRHGTEYWANRTHCPQGHAYDAANTYIHPKRGSRLCRTCATTYKRERRRDLGDRTA